MVLLMLGCMRRSTLAVWGEIGGNSCLAFWLVMDRWKDGGSSLVVMIVWGRLVVAASAKVGRRSLIAMSPRSSLSLLEMEDQQEEVGNSLDRFVNI